MSDLLRQKKDTNAAFNNFINSFSTEMSKSTMVAKIGKVKSFDSKNMTCEVLPLPSADNALLINVPVATLKARDFVAYYPLKADDYVVLLFMDGDIDEILLGGDSAKSERAHDVSDCIAIGGISLVKDNLDIVDSDGLVLQNLSTDSFINLRQNGDISVKGDVLDINARQVNINATGVNIQANLRITGNATYNGRQIATTIGGDI